MEGNHSIDVRKRLGGGKEFSSLPPVHIHTVSLSFLSSVVGDSRARLVVWGFDGFVEGLVSGLMSVLDGRGG